MSVEVELKLAVGSHGPTRSRLAAAGASRLGQVVETNWFFDWQDGRLAASGAGLRIRHAQDRQRRTVATTLTYKGPAPAEANAARTDRTDQAVIARPELELAINDVEIARRLLAALGMVEILVYQKRRESWRLGPCRVELDELPQLGCFVEIEGPGQEAISQARQALGLLEADAVSQSYLALLLEQLPRRGEAGYRIMLGCQHADGQ